MQRKYFSLPVAPRRCSTWCITGWRRWIHCRYEHTDLETWTRARRCLEGKLLESGQESSWVRSSRFEHIATPYLGIYSIPHTQSQSSRSNGESLGWFRAGWLVLLLPKLSVMWCYALFKHVHEGYLEHFVVVIPLGLAVSPVTCGIRQRLTPAHATRKRRNEYVAVEANNAAKKPNETKRKKTKQIYIIASHDHIANEDTRYLQLLAITLRYAQQVHAHCDEQVQLTIKQ